MCVCVCVCVCVCDGKGLLKNAAGVGVIEEIDRGRILNITQGCVVEEIDAESIGEV